MANEILNSTICAKSGFTMTVRDSIDYIVSIILTGLNPANGCWYESSERVECQLQDAIDDKELIDSIMKQFNNHVTILNNDINKQNVTTMTEKEKSIISSVALSFSFWTNYIKVLANRKTDEREEIITVCNSMNKELEKLIALI